ncbi:MAG: 2-amino-4-hydroxy-6-hydroxymethyldihydropteridine diphosphokinase [Candidatus Gastranaerophilales bacterium]|nr:2-amino-4-hydroxy-6-hydroxymethyldihydropteridine diphosphokinase [Candidatus Gastranaerophilales bacterium]
MSIAYLCLGSNLGDKIGYIQQSHILLNDIEGIKVLKASSFYETEPYGFKNQEWFVNAVLEIETILNPNELLNKCINIENKLGRNRSDDFPRWGPRCIDIDILLYDNQVISDKNLTIPHPLFEKRSFALVPMLEINPDLIHPVLNKSIEQIHCDLEEVESVYLYGTRPKGF